MTMFQKLIEIFMVCNIILSTSIDLKVSFNICKNKWHDNLPCCSNLFKTKLKEIVAKK